VGRLRPGDPLGWYNLGALLQNRQRSAEAIPAFQEALRLMPEMALAWLGLGSAQRSQGHRGEALAAYRQAVRFDPDLAAAWYRLGNLLEHDEEFGEAMRAYREAVRCRRDYALAWYSLAVLCREDGLLEEAVAAFLENLRVKPHDTDAWLGLGITYAKQGSREGVLEVYQELAILDAEAAESFAREYVDGWEPASKPEPPPAGVRGGHRPSRKGHPLAEAWYDMGVFHRDHKQPVEAMSDFAEAVRFDASHAKAWFSLAVLYRANGRLDDALRALRELLRLKPGLAIAWRHLASIHAQRGQHEKAAKAYRKVVQVEPNDVEGWIGLGRTCVALDYPAGVAEVVEKLRGLNPAAADRLAQAYAGTPTGPLGGGLRVPKGRSPALGTGATGSPDQGDGPSGFDAWLTSLRRPPSLDARDADSGRLPLAVSRSGDTA
jgi:tetratricopeptide (TPR) repeat protein